MRTHDRLTLAQFLAEERDPPHQTADELDNLICDVALACKAIAKEISYGALAGVLGAAGSENVQGEEQKKLDILSNALFLRATEWRGHLAGMVSEEMEQPYPLPPQYRRGQYLLLFDPLDGSSNIDVNVAVGSIFSVLRTSNPGLDALPQDYLQPGTAQVCAGYAIYGPSAMLVLTLGRGTHGFTLDPVLGEWVLTHRDLRIPETTREFAINASNSRFWHEPVKRYVDECLAGATGPRGRDFNMRWIASLVAEAHRILMRGGVFLYPRDAKDPDRAGRLRLLYEANPIAFVVEQAGGSASTGHERMLEVTPEALHQRVSLIFGSSSEVDRLANYHRDAVVA